MNDDASKPSSAEAPDDFVSAAWRRVKEHRIAQWTVGYVALAYGIQHAITLTSEAYEWPNLVTRLSMTLLAMGLPIAMTLSWYHGERASRRVSGPELAIISLLMMTSSLLFAVLVHPAGVTMPRIQEASVTAARQASLSPTTAISLAVMPFDNLSPDPNQGYFVDGMGDEIITALAKIPDLRVVGRESALEFKGKHANFRDAGRALNASHLLEGSVRKAGDQLRISAELVRADTGATVWANSYDRELKDVFAVQEDIARSIAASLHMTLNLKPGENLVSNRINDEPAHELYLRALAAWRVRDRQQTDKLLDELLMRAPDFAPGWALRSVELSNRGLGGGGAPVVEQAVGAAQKAVALDPALATAYGALGLALYAQGKWAEAFEAIKHGLALDPTDPEILYEDWVTLRFLGYLKQALAVSEKLSSLEPSIPNFTRDRGETQMANGLTDAGVRTLETALQQGQVTTRRVNVRPAAFLAMAYAQQGRYRDAAGILLRADVGAANGGPFQSINRQNLAAAAAVLSAAADGQKPLSPLPRFDSLLNFVYAVAGVPERMLEWGEKESFELRVLWWPMPGQVRKTERFKSFVRKAGLVDLWRKNGWPDLCHPVGADDFECS